MDGGEDRCPAFIEDVADRAAVGESGACTVIRDNDALADIRRLGFGVGRQECMPGWDSVAVRS
ncbi:hypothetical protein P3T27_005132 [Kitasatospora sp. MAA19]|uniref:hypothetical protein n=1 Tax=Kitasatospora sp. MAA19 TaxID=3035090 RepID=UPI002475A9DF|nr:hypothetical protein [Kitasatospora sp. MAA19]MDH6708393.1 hypothetical protein [Kitasatospora sp. MAA19]